MCRGSQNNQADRKLVLVDLLYECSFWCALLFQLKPTYRGWFLYEDETGEVMDIKIRCTMSYQRDDTVNGMSYVWSYFTSIFHNKNTTEVPSVSQKYFVLFAHRIYQCWTDKNIRPIFQGAVLLPCLARMTGEAWTRQGRQRNMIGMDSIGQCLKICPGRLFSTTSWSSDEHG